MATVKQLMGDVFAKLLFKEALVRSVYDVTPHFRRLDLEGPALRGVGCKPGDKVQLLMPTGDLRTYTPFHVDSARGAMSLLVYLHGEAPGSVWGRQISAAATVRLFGPRGSLPLVSLTGPLVLFGDETSFAVARALKDLRGGADRLHFVFEVNDAVDSAAALQSLELPTEKLVQRQPDDTHLPAIEAHVRAGAAALGAAGAATLVLTGRAQSIQALRARLKGTEALSEQRVKAYWSVGKRGLD